jgi:hypothetical protein
MSTALTSQRRHALGLPAGSIRALLAFGVLGFLWALALVPGPKGDGILNQKDASQAFVYLQIIMVLILAHFFVAHGKSIGSTVSNRSPLGLPRYSVRVILLVGYLGLAYWMYNHRTANDFAAPETAPLLLMIAVLFTAFFIGYVLTGLVSFLWGGSLPFWFQDVQAWFALIALLLLGILILLRLVINPSLELPLSLGNIEIALAAFVGFYFGARS